LYIGCNVLQCKVSGATQATCQILNIKKIDENVSFQNYNVLKIIVFENKKIFGENMSFRNQPTNHCFCSYTTVRYGKKLLFLGTLFNGNLLNCAHCIILNEL
jgi:hypothetical protein